MGSEKNKQEMTFIQNGLLRYSIHEPDNVIIVHGSAAALEQVITGLYQTFSDPGNSERSVGLPARYQEVTRALYNLESKDDELVCKTIEELEKSLFNQYLGSNTDQFLAKIMPLSPYHAQDWMAEEGEVSFLYRVTNHDPERDHFYTPDEMKARLTQVADAFKNVVEVDDTE